MGSCVGQTLEFQPVTSPALLSAHRAASRGTQVLVPLLPQGLGLPLSFPGALLCGLGRSFLFFLPILSLASSHPAPCPDWFFFSLFSALRHLDFASFTVWLLPSQNFQNFRVLYWPLLSTSSCIWSISLSS